MLISDISVLANLLLVFVRGSSSPFPLLFLFCFFFFFPFRLLFLFFFLLSHLPHLLIFSSVLANLLLVFVGGFSSFHLLYLLISSSPPSLSPSSPLSSPPVCWPTCSWSLSEDPAPDGFCFPGCWCTLHWYGLWWQWLWCWSGLIELLFRWFCWDENLLI